jgi:maltose-binding protein MalE
MRARAILASATAAVIAIGLVACGATRTMRMTYIKRDSSEARMLQDESDLKRTKGVKQVITHIDTDNAINLQLFVDEDDSTAGRQKALDLGYSQVRN